jgi:hypothetical protein
MRTQKGLLPVPVHSFPHSSPSRESNVIIIPPSEKKNCAKDLLHKRRINRLNHTMEYKRFYSSVLLRTILFFK